MQITRKYTHAAHGDIGSVELIVPDAGWTLDGVALPISSVRHLATFALQSLQDAYAGAKSADEASDAFATKYDRIREGTIGTHTGGSRDPVRARAVLIALRHVKIDVTGLEKADADKARRAAALKAVERNPAYRSLAQSQLDAEAAMPDYVEPTDEPATDEEADAA